MSSLKEKCLGWLANAKSAWPLRRSNGLAEPMQIARDFEIPSELKAAQRNLQLISVAGILLAFSYPPANQEGLGIALPLFDGTVSINKTLISCGVLSYIFYLGYKFFHELRRAQRKASAAYNASTESIIERYLQQVSENIRILLERINAYNTLVLEQNSALQSNIGAAENIRRLKEVWPKWENRYTTLYNTMRELSVNANYIYSQTDKEGNITISQRDFWHFSQEIRRNIASFNNMQGMLRIDNFPLVQEVERLPDISPIGDEVLNYLRNTDLKVENDAERLLRMANDLHRDDVRVYTLDKYITSILAAVSALVIFIDLCTILQGWLSAAPIYDRSPMFQSKMT